MANPNFYHYGYLISCLALLIAQFGAGDEAVLLGGKKLIVGVPKKDGFTQFVEAQLSPSNKTELVRVTGYSIEVFNATVDYLRTLGYLVNISFEFQAFVNESGSSAGSYNMLVEQIPAQKYDVVVGDVTIVANRSKYVDFTLPYAESGVMMLVKVRHDRHLDMWIFLKPFSWDLWLSIVVFCIFVGGTILFMERSVIRDARYEISPPREQVTSVSSMFFTLAHLDRESVVKNCSRFVLVLWFILGCILMQSYTASLSSILTLDQLQPSYLRGEINVGYQCGSFVEDLLKDRLKFDESKLKSFCTIEEYKVALDKGSFNGGVDAIFDEVPYIKVFLKKYGSNYAMVGPRYRTDGFGFAFPKGSNLTSYFSSAILNVTESAVMDQIESKYFGSNDEDKLQDQSSPSSDNASLTAYSFIGLFILIGILILLALLLSETSHIWKRPVSMARIVSKRLFSQPSARNSETGEGSTRIGNVGSPEVANNHREVPSRSPSSLAIEI